MALGYDMTDLINSTNAAAEAIYAYLDREEEKKRYENEQKRLDEQAALEEKWRKNNYELQASAFNYQKELNQKQMDREDTQFSRAMADYKRAGLSGLAAIGSSAGAGSMTSLPAPQMDTSGSRDVINSRINSNRNRTQSRLERYKAVMSSHLQSKQLQLESTNQVLQGIKLGNEISKAKLEKEKLSAETTAIKHRDSWEYDEGHGYRNQNWQSAFIALVEDYIKNNKNGVGSSHYNRDSYNDVLSPYEKTFLENIEKEENADITKMTEKQLVKIWQTINNLPKEEQKTYKNVKRAVSNEFYKKINGFYR